MSRPHRLPALRAGLLALLLALAPTARAEPAGAAAIIASLAAPAPVRARFVEERSIALLSEPLITEGTLSFTPPDRLVRQDLLPKPALYEVSGGIVEVRIGETERHLALADEPALAALILPFHATLRGDLAALSAAYRIATAGDPAAWRMTLTPRAPELARLVSRIELEGGAGWVDRVLILEQDGDRTLMRLTRAGA